eukprot:6698166-Alexandrium_andersonii.AAC.1
MSGRSTWANRNGIRPKRPSGPQKRATVWPKFEIAGPIAAWSLRPALDIKDGAAGSGKSPGGAA